MEEYSIAKVITPIKPAKGRIIPVGVNLSVVNITKGSLPTVTVVHPDTRLAIVCTHDEVELINEGTIGTSFSFKFYLPNSGQRIKVSYPDRPTREGKFIYSNDSNSLPCWLYTTEGQFSYPIDDFSSWSFI